MVVKLNTHDLNLLQIYQIQLLNQARKQMACIYACCVSVLQGVYIKSHNYEYIFNLASL
jgi:hypothetical protein